MAERNLPFVFPLPSHGGAEYTHPLPSPLPWRSGEYPSSAMGLPWHSGEFPSSFMGLPWHSGEFPSSAMGLPWRSGEYPSSPWRSGEFPSSPLSPPMAEPVVRIRLVFEHPLLSDSKLDSRSWFFLNPYITATVADLNDQIAKFFHIDPHTFKLFVDGYAVPPFTPTRFFRENEIIRVVADDGGDLEGDAETGLDDRSVQLLANVSTSMPKSQVNDEEKKGTCRGEK